MRFPVPAGVNVVTPRRGVCAMLVRGPLFLLRRAEHFMGMPETLERWTAERVRALPDDGLRHEIVDGELFVTPAPSADHQRAVLEMAVALRAYLKGQGLGEVMVSPADLELDARTLVQPDVFVVPLTAGARPRRWSDVGGLLLAVEILSPSTARADRTAKRRRYQRAGIPEYWIVDLDARVVERWRPGDDRPEILTDRLEWQPVTGRDALALDIGPWFAAVLD